MEKVVIGTKECRAEIAFLGAQLESLQSPDGREYLWQRDPKWWSGCAPVLFPMMGALRQGRTVIEGRIYEMPQHGLARRREFSLLSQAEDEAVFSLRADDATRQQYLPGRGGFPHHGIPGVQPRGNAHALRHRRPPGLQHPPGRGGAVRGLLCGV